ncbi:transcriptional repressor [Verticiella sediminum]|uniref:Transcriptional repressor n=1 Tax=Verticiella sediminum TaxID=1247510 RepID=A0A556AIR5_9BURK|nr:Fur family transcriptional regulator [Verticiella sediminum]TSH92760.1 transcriptional repressor [Verticiella sediminum]
MSAHRKLTANQQRVLEALRQGPGALSAYALLERAGFSGPSQVYRALDKLMGLGLVRRLESLNAYICCSGSGACRPTAFAICDCCGHIDEMVDGPLAQCLQCMANHLDFKLDRAVVEVHGRCSACAAPGSPGHD